MALRVRDGVYLARLQPNRIGGSNGGADALEVEPNPACVHPNLGDRFHEKK